ncbi:hypothetical protein [Candidatus Ichthyocystis hellenicum]|uniref:hypothetical protein n=1 Tax=Candidatus Ichthyocystis hellenicum TaxID=1561003 RepID=UPI000B82C276|nr:hypothetical protein [Candidatus Ichthyocystis hellenicum]
MSFLFTLIGANDRLDEDRLPSSIEVSSSPFGRVRSNSVQFISTDTVPSLPCGSSGSDTTTDSWVFSSSTFVVICSNSLDTQQFPSSGEWRGSRELFSEKGEVTFSISSSSLSSSESNSAILLVLKL